MEMGRSLLIHRKDFHLQAIYTAKRAAMTVPAMMEKVFLAELVG